MSQTETAGHWRSPLQHNPLWRTLRTLRGNPKACVLTEPMWGISMALVLPYASVFMLALGITDARIGLIASIGMIAQVGWGLASGIITDKMGRRLAVAIFDIVCWVFPSIIWAVAQNFWYFVVASVLNGAVLVTQNSWDCLMVEDAEREQLTNIYSLVKVASDLSALFMPLAALLVSRWGLVFAVRLLYINAAFVMAVKVFVLYRFSRETRTGLRRRAETRHTPITEMLAGYRGVFGKLIWRSPGTLFSLLVMALVAAIGVVTGVFWPVLVTGRLGVPDAVLPFFQMIRSLVSIVFLFTIIPRLTSMADTELDETTDNAAMDIAEIGDSDDAAPAHRKAPDLRRATMLGFGVYLVGQLLLVAIPLLGLNTGFEIYAFLGATLILDSFGAGILFTMAESLVALHIDETERSRVMAIQRTVVTLSAAPFGWIAGWLSSVNRIYPFILSSILLLVGLLLAAFKWVSTDQPA